MSAIEDPFECNLITNITMNHTQESELMNFRKMGNNDPESVRIIVNKIFDKKLKSFLSLETKQEVLEKCQELLIDKTIDYMNVISDMETGHLKSLNSLNYLLGQKSDSLADLAQKLAKTKQVVRQQETTIATLRQDLDSLNRQLEASKNILQCEEANHSRAVSILQREHCLERSEFHLTRKSLESANQQLSQELKLAVEELGRATLDFQTQMQLLMIQKEKEVQEGIRKLNRINDQNQRDKGQMIKDKSFLQELIELKDQQLRDWRRGAQSKEFSSSHQFSLTVIPTQKALRSEETRGRTVSKSKSRGDRLKRTTDDLNRLVYKQMGVQCMDIQNTTYRQYRNDTNDRYSQTVTENPQDTSDVTESELKLRDYLDEKYRLIYDEKSKSLGDKYRNSFKSSLVESKDLVASLTRLTKDQLELSSLKFLELEQVYQSRPSREEDLEYIVHLIEENRSLIGLCRQANSKTDNAYMALQEYHSQLQSYKRLVPVSITGIPSPQIHSAREMRGTQSNRPFVSNSSWGMTQPLLSRKRVRNAKPEDDTFQGTMKDVLMTELQFSEAGSPIRKRNHGLRPHTGKVSSILSLRRKSGAN